MKGLIKYVCVGMIFVVSTCLAQDSLRAGYYNTVLMTSPSTITLMPPDTMGGKPLMWCLKERKTSRSFDSKPLSRQVLSNLLWAAFGINRPDGRRTAPSAMNMQEIGVYVALEEGLYLYDAGSQSLKLVLKEDIRGKTGTQSFVREAPVDIVYVADLSKASRASADDKILYTAADCGFIAQNVYLYCAAEGLACVVRGSIDRTALSEAMDLGPDQKIILSQTVGYPK
jgi:SagB-type dehydrogenase family enzyme